MKVKPYYTTYLNRNDDVILISQTKKMYAMLEYAKVILPKVSFSKDLFMKELNKCIGWVEKDQIRELYAWCNENFKEIYPEVLAIAFAGFILK